MTATIACPGCGAKVRVPAAAAGRPRCPRCKALLPWVVDATDRDFDRECVAPVPVLADFWAPWCGPCRSLSPTVDAMAVEQAGQLKVVRVNVDDAPELSRRYQVRGVPTLLLMRGGQILDQQVGAPGAAALRSWVRPHLTGQPR